MRIIWQTVRRNTNDILGVKGLAKVLGLYFKLWTNFSCMDLWPSGSVQAISPSRKKLGYVHYCTNYENNGSKIFTLSLGLNRREKFQFKQTFAVNLAG